MKRNLLPYIIGMGALLAGGLSSCSEEETPSLSGEAGTVLFQGMLESAKVTSRAGENYIIMGSNSDKFGDIHILQKCESSSPEEEYSCIYELASGVQGLLNPKGGSPLQWKGTDIKHTFYAWTEPVAGSTPDGGVHMDDEIQGKGTVVFGTQEKTGTDNLGLEQFIVAKTNEISYSTNGSYVGLHFYRPVVKIGLDSLIHINGDGSRTALKKCTITFPNLYKKADFDVRKEAWNGEDGDVWIEATSSSEYEKGVTWEWEKPDQEKDTLKYMLYVHPFVFKEGTNEEEQPGYFTITAEVEKSGGDYEAKTYRGTLAGNSQITELKAGQFMKMNLAVADGKVAGVGSYIVDWNTGAVATVPHKRAGVYTQEDAKELLAALQENPADIPAYFYEEDAEGEKVIHIYTHMDWSSLMKELAIPEGYVLDGGGYYIKFGEGGSLSGDFENVYTPEGTEYFPTNN